MFVFSFRVLNWLTPTARSEGLVFGRPHPSGAVRSRAAGVLLGPKTRPAGRSGLGRSSASGLVVFWDPTQGCNTWAAVWRMEETDDTQSCISFPCWYFYFYNTTAGFLNLL